MRITTEILGSPIHLMLPPLLHRVTRAFRVACVREARGLFLPFCRPVTGPPWVMVPENLCAYENVVRSASASEFWYVFRFGMVPDLDVMYCRGALY
jgi:hypothetical protein